MLLALDCETTGIDLFHGARPFAITSCDLDGNLRWWEGRVDPLTRAVFWAEEDLQEVRDTLKRVAASKGVLVGQNFKFDATALASVGVTNVPWARLRDTLLAAHLLNSNRKKNLTDLSARHCGVNIAPFEKALELATKAGRRLVQNAQARVRNRRKKDAAYDGSDEPLAAWAIAAEEDEDMPSAGKETWRFDYWLAGALAAFHGWPRPAEDCKHDWAGVRADDNLCRRCGGHGWWVVCRDYFNADSYATARLWPAMEKELERRKLRKIYDFSLKRLPVLVAMERRGLTVNAETQERLVAEFDAESQRLRADLRSIARSRRYDLQLPKGAAPNHSLLGFVFGRNPVNDMPPRPGIKEEHPGCLRLEWAVRTDAGGPSLDSKNAIPYYLDTLPPDSKAHRFVKKLAESREWDTALTYLRSYARFRLPLSEWGGGEWHVLHPTFNPTGSATLRHSCERPNAENVSKRKRSNLRRVFGPAPGREWWCLDYSNLELRIPAYESGEQDLIALFERPDDPPFFGSEHLLNFSVIYPDLWEEAIGRAGAVEKAADWIKSKDGWKDTWYQWCKNGDFAVQYGAVDKASGTGTADRAFHRPGSHAKLRARFAKKEKLNRHWIQYANRYGYVETMPDRLVDPERGYPLLVTRTENGRILETVPLSYHVQGTACWVKISGMLKCAAQLEEWRRKDGFDAHLINDVHDELDFDFPSGGRANLWRVLRLKALMESCGDDIGVPLVAEYAWHPHTWGQAEKLPEEGMAA